MLFLYVVVIYDLPTAALF